MTEWGVEAQQFNTFDIGIKSWTKMADKLIHDYGESCLLEYPGAKQVQDIPLLTYGAYTCYAGVAQSPDSGLFIFHFYEDDAHARLVSTIGGEPIAGVYGGIPYNIQRTSQDQFGNTPLKLLNPKDAALGGFNVLTNGVDIFYASGQYTP